MTARFTWLSGSVAATLAMLSACGGGAFTAGGQGGDPGAADGGGADASLGGMSAGGVSGATGGAGGVTAQGGKPGGTGGSTLGAGGLSGIGGRIDGFGGTNSGSCDSLWQNYMQEMQAARTCSPDVAAKQCSVDYMLPDLCGCDVPANGTSEHYTKARELYTRWKRSCPAAACLVPCVLDQGEPACKSTSSGQSVCNF